MDSRWIRSGPSSPIIVEVLEVLRGLGATACGRIRTRAIPVITIGIAISIGTFRTFGAALLLGLAGALVVN